MCFLVFLGFSQFFLSIFFYRFCSSGHFVKCYLFGFYCFFLVELKVFGGRHLYQYLQNNVFWLVLSS